MRKDRLALLDALRGTLMLSVIVYHAAWDAVYLFGLDWPWFHGDWLFVWQQATCWGFLLLSGFCASLGNSRLRLARRGGLVFSCGAAVSLVTLYCLPDSRVLFGVLTLIGSAMLLLSAVRPLADRLPVQAGLPGAFALFLLTYHTARGWWGVGPLRLVLPHTLYANLLSAYLGFPPPEFFSTDYFPLLPWFFLCLTGYFLGRLCRPKLPDCQLCRWSVPVLSRLGRHALPIYLAHQPVLYLVFFLLSPWISG